MKLPGHSLLPALCVALIAAALLWEQQQEIAALKFQATSTGEDLARRTAERNDLEKRFQTAQVETKTLQTALADALQKPALDAKAGGAKAGRAAMENGPVTAEMIKLWLAEANDPTVMRRLNVQARNQTLKHYGDLLKQLNLPPDQYEQLVKLLTDKRQAPLDAAVASFQQGEDPSTDVAGFRKQIVAVRDDLENQINSLLGDAAYGQYLNYDRVSGQSNAIGDLQTALTGTSEPLTPEQTARLQQVMQDNNTGHVTPKVITDSRGFLSPTQVQALQDLRAIQLANSVKRNQAVQVLPTAAAGK